MSFSNEWTEHHLTSRGWESGSERTDGPGIQIKEPSKDRVMTYKCSEVQNVSHARTHRSGAILWESGYRELIKELLDKFGQPPETQHVFFRDGGHLADGVVEALSLRVTGTGGPEAASWH
jgi:hypothetical protein